MAVVAHAEENEIEDRNGAAPPHDALADEPLVTFGVAALGGHAVDGFTAVSSVRAARP